jgi:hypothetical protein
MTRREILEALRHGRSSFDDGDAVVEDGFLPVRERELGHALRVRNYGDARKSVNHMFDVLIAHFSEPEPGDACRAT